MAIEEIRPFIKNKLEAIGLTEWMDGFPDDNIPSTLIDGSFHQVIGSAAAVDNSSKNISMSVPAVVRVFSKAFRDPYTKISEAQVLGESCIKAICDPAMGRSGSITQIYFDSMEVVALDSVENDNMVVIELTFDCIVTLCF